MMSHTSPRNVVEIRALHCGYGSDFQIVAENLFIPRSKPVVLKGNNGSGKTTILRALARLQGPQVLRHEVEGCDGFYYVDPAAEGSVFLSLRVDECVAAMTGADYPLWTALGGVGRNFQRFLQALPEEVRPEIAALKDDFAEELSGGQKALLGIAAGAVAAGHRILLLDEPAAHLDQDNRRLLARFICGLAREGRGVWTVSHDDQFAALLTDHHVLSVGQGKVTSNSPEVAL